MALEGYINCNVNILQNGVTVKTIVIPVDDLPDECPFCHQKIHPTYAAGFCFYDEIDRFIALFLCPDYNCNEFFLTEYIDEEFDEKKNKLSGKPYLLHLLRRNPDWLAKIPGGQELAGLIVEENENPESASSSAQQPESEATFTKKTQSVTLSEEWAGFCGAVCLCSDLRYIGKGRPYIT